MPLISTFGAASARGFGVFLAPSSPYFIGVMKPSAGDYYLTGGDGFARQFSAINSDGMFVAGGDGGTGQFQKINPSKTFDFQKTITGSGGFTTNYLTALFAASSGNLYTAGAGNDGFGRGSWITKWSSAGSLTWSIAIPNETYDVQALTADSSENIYFTGRINTSQSSGGSNRIAVVRLTSSGSKTWDTQYGLGSDSFTPGGIAQYSSSVFISGTVALSGSSKGLFFSLDTSSGSLNFEQMYASNTVFNSLAASSSGNFYIGGQSSNNQSLVLKLDSSGTKQWGRRLQTGYTVCVVGIDSSENVYALSRGNVNSYTFVLHKYNASGTIQWQRNLSLPSTFTATTSFSISISNNGNIFICAQIYNGSQYYPFVALLKPDGSGTGTYTLDGGTYTYTASSYTSSTDSDSFSTSYYTVTAQSRTPSSVSLSQGTGNLTLIQTAI